MKVNLFINSGAGTRWNPATVDEPSLTILRARLEQVRWLDVTFENGNRGLVNTRSVLSIIEYEE